MYNYSKLLGKIKEQGYTQDEFARTIGINPATLNKKLKNNTQFKQTEMQKILDVLGESLSNITYYFYVH